MAMVEAQIYYPRHSYIYVVECIASIIGTNYCPDYYPPYGKVFSTLYDWSGQS